VPIFVDLVPPDAKLAIMTSPSFLHPYFPTTGESFSSDCVHQKRGGTDVGSSLLIAAEEKMLIHQYFHCTTRIIVARDSEINVRPSVDLLRLSHGD
jgi:hypothetical protein